MLATTAARSVTAGIDNVAVNRIEHDLSFSWFMKMRYPTSTPRRPGAIINIPRRSHATSGTQ
jgi:hypothetical protein